MRADHQARSYSVASSCTRIEIETQEPNVAKVSITGAVQLRRVPAPAIASAGSGAHDKGSQKASRVSGLKLLHEVPQQSPLQITGIGFDPTESASKRIFRLRRSRLREGGLAHRLSAWQPPIKRWLCLRLGTDTVRTPFATRTGRTARPVQANVQSVI